MFEEIACASKGKRIIMFLDYDGTLSPIVDDPDRAFMSDAVCDVNFYTPSPNYIYRLLNYTTYIRSVILPKLTASSLLHHVQLDLTWVCENVTDESGST